MYIFGYFLAAGRYFQSRRCPLNFDSAVLLAAPKAPENEDETPSGDCDTCCLAGDEPLFVVLADFEDVTLPLDMGL